MSPIALQSQLDAVGRTLVRWRTQLKIFGCAAGVLAATWLFSMTDLWLQYDRGGRVFIALLLWSAIGGSAWWIRRSLNRRMTPQGVAAKIEKTFPQLDNHLINFLQFSAEAKTDVFKQAYLDQGLPEWNGLDFEEMKDRDRHKKAHIALAVAVALIIAPALFVGPAWGVSLWRVINPFTNLKPVSLTNILKVDPGTSTVLQGQPAVLTVTVKGQYGHRVSIDVDPADKQKTSHSLGMVKGAGDEEFSFRIPKVNTVTRYRFRAGDAALPEWYTLTPRPPLGIDALKVQVRPPEYTGLAATVYDGLADDIAVPDGSEVRFNVTSNLDMQSLVLQRETGEAPFEEITPTNWRGAQTVTNGVPFRLAAVGDLGDRLNQTVHFVFEPDRLPAIKVLAPEGRPVLAPGAVPAISFAVADDFGLSEVMIEQVMVGAERGAKGTVLRHWELDGEKELTATWEDRSWHSRKDQVLAYRIIARDNYPFADEKRRSASARIVFLVPSAAQVSDKRNKLEKEATAALTQVIEMQRQNLNKTKAFRELLATTPPEQWQQLAAVQNDIRKICRTLLANPLKPLGTLAPTVKKLYLNEMMEAVPALAGVPNTLEAERPAKVERAISLETKILRQLTFANSAAAKAQVQRRVSALSSMLRKMIKEQTGIIKDTMTCVTQNTQVGEQLIDRQDELALDYTDFLHACKSESAQVMGNDETYGKLLLELARIGEEINIRGDMMLAAEQLEENNAKQAVPHETAALKKLRELEAKLDAVLAQEGLEEQEAMLEAVAEAKKRLEKMEEVYKKALEAMEMVGEMKDKDTKETDLLEEEYEELVKNLKEALLQVPTDLNIFMELNVANDIVEDVFSVFEEIEQAPGSENLDKGDVTERALAKREEYLEGMEEAKDRLDNMESWLGDKPDSMKITTEAFDQEEMPEAGIALGALQTEAEDLIGDLLESNEEADEEADDSATNTSVPDMVANNEVKEGDVASFAAQGKSGNETPDHKEQDGRSNVGRQGMAVGETAAGSGTINEGDQDIEERRTQEPTQSGQVDVEGEDVKTNATGGGKLGTGKGDDVGMEGGVKRMDSTEEGSREGLDALMQAQKAEKMYAKASMKNVRADSLKDAAHHLRQASDAVAKGNIAQLKEHRKLAIAALRKAKAKIGDAMTGSFDLEANPSFIEDVVDGGPDAAPEKYRDLVAEYYKSLNKGL